MSSHHFVKEGQEPALLVCDPVAIQHVEALLEWAPLVAVIHRALANVILWGTKVDAVIAPAHEAPGLHEDLRDQAPVHIITYTNEPEMLPTALQYLVDKGQTAVNIVLEHPQPYFDTLRRFADKLTIIVVEPATKWSLIRGKYQKWMPAGQTLSIIKTDDNQVITTTGLEGTGTAFTTTSTGVAGVGGNGLFWVGEPL